MRSALITTISIFLGSMLGGCNHPSKTTLSALIVQGPEGDVLKNLATQTAVPLEVEELPYADLFDREAGLEQKGGIDLVLLDDPWIPRFARHLEPLPEDADIRQFPDNSRNICIRPGETRMRALPLVGNVQLFFYNERLCGSEAPKTWDELKQLAKKIHSSGKAYGYVMRAASGNSIVTDFFPLLWASGGDLDLGHDPPFTPTVEPAVKALELMLELGKLSPPGYSGFEAEEVADHMRNGTAAMGINWLAWTPAMPPQVITADLPAPNGKSMALLGIWVLAVPDNAPHKREAKEFLKLLSRREAWLDRGGKPIAPLSPPARLDMLQTGPFREHAQRLGLARPRPRSERWREIEGILGFYLSQAHVGLLSAKDAIEEAQAKIRLLVQTTEATGAPQGIGN